MAQPGTFITVVIALVIVGAIIQVLLLAYRYRNGNLGPAGQTVDGDVVYQDDRINEMLYASPPDGEDEQDLDFDPEETETVACPACRTLNEAEYSYCRSCATELSNA